MKRPLCWISLGCFFAAVVFGYLYPADGWISPASALLGLLGLFFLLWGRTRPISLFFLSASFMLLFCLAFGYFHAAPARSLAGQNATLSGTVLETGNASFLLDGETEKGQSIKVQVWCSADMVPDRYQQFSGTVALSEITSTDRFDSENYYRSQDVWLQGRLLSGSFSGKASFSLRTWPGRLNDFLCQKIRSSLPVKYSGLVCAAILGNRSYLPDGQYELFRQLGISHLLAVSGMHLTLLSGLFSLIIGRFLRKSRAKTILFMAFVLFYMLLTGMRPSIARAGMMLLLSCVAQLILRRPDPPVSLSAAVLVMILYHPFLAVHAGFQFSICSTIGVQILAGPLSQKLLSLKKAPASRGFSYLIRSCCTALCGYACAAPLTVLYDSCLIPMSIPANLCLSPLFTLFLAVSAGLVLFCAVPVLGSVFAFGVRLFVGLFLGAANCLGRIGPKPIFGSGPALLIAVVCFSAVIGYGAFRPTFRHFAAAICLAVSVSCAAVSTQAIIENRQIHCYTVAFDKKLLQIFSYGGHAIVIGHLSAQPQIEQAALELQRERVQTIDALILLPSGGNPRVSLSELTGHFSVSAVAFSSADNLSTQAAESLAGIPSYDFDGLCLTFWQNNRIHLDGEGAVSLCIGSKKLLILPADCAILYEEEPCWDLAITCWDVPPPVSVDALLCARHFWGTENQNPNSYLLPYGKGVRFRLSAG